MQFFNKLLKFVLLIPFMWSCFNFEAPDETEFMKAVRLGRTDDIGNLLSQDPALLYQKTELEGKNALHIAAHKANIETIEFLIEKGVNVNETSKDGSTALHYALSNFRNAFGVTRTLLESEIDPSIKNNDGHTAWDVIYNKRLKRGKYSKKENELLSLMLKYDYLPDATLNEDQSTLLHLFAEKAEDPEIIRLLIEKHRFDPNATDKFGWTPLHYAAKGINEDIATVLVDNGAEVNALTTTNRGRKQSKPNAKIRYEYPAGSTPRDVYSKQSSGRGKTLMRFFNKYGGKRSRDL